MPPSWNDEVRLCKSSSSSSASEKPCVWSIAKLHNYIADRNTRLTAEGGGEPNPLYSSMSRITRYHGKAVYINETQGSVSGAGNCSTKMEQGKQRYDGQR